MSALDLVRQAWMNKQQYAQYLIDHPGAVETGAVPGNTLDVVHRANLSLEDQLTQMGFGDAADSIKSMDATALKSWMDAHQDYLSGGSGSGSVPLDFTGGSASGSGSVPGAGGIGGVLSSVWGAIQTLSGDVQGVLNIVAHPDTWLSNLGAGIGAGAQSAGQGIAAGVTPVYRAIFWPVAIFAGLGILGGWYKRHRRHRLI